MLYTGQCACAYIAVVSVGKVSDDLRFSFEILEFPKVIVAPLIDLSLITETLSPVSPCTTKLRKAKLASSGKTSAFIHKQVPSHAGKMKQVYE